MNGRFVFLDKKRKYFSDMERYEIININDGDKYSHLGHNDVIIDEDGNISLTREDVYNGLSVQFIKFRN